MSTFTTGMDIGKTVMMSRIRQFGNFIHQKRWCCHGIVKVVTGKVVPLQVVTQHFGKVVQLHRVVTSHFGKLRESHIWTVVT